MGVQFRLFFDCTIFEAFSLPKTKTRRSYHGPHHSAAVDRKNHLLRWLDRAALWGTGTRQHWQIVVFGDQPFAEESVRSQRCIFRNLHRVSTSRSDSSSKRIGHSCEEACRSIEIWSRLRSHNAVTIKLPHPARHGGRQRTRARQWVDVSSSRYALNPSPFFTERTNGAFAGEFHASSARLESRIARHYSEAGDFGAFTSPCRADSTYFGSYTNSCNPPIRSDNHSDKSKDGSSACAPSDKRRLPAQHKKP